MGIGGGIITKKLLFTVLLIASLSLSGIATANAAEVGTIQKQTSDTNALIKDTKTQSKSENISKNQTNTQKMIDKRVKTVENDNYKKTESTQNKKSQNTATENKVVKDNIFQNAQTQETAQNIHTVTKNTEVSTTSPVTETETAISTTRTQTNEKLSDASNETAVIVPKETETRTESREPVTDQNMANVDTTTTNHNSVNTTPGTATIQSTTTHSNDNSVPVTTESSATSSDDKTEAVNTDITTEEPVKTSVTPDTTTQTTDKPVTTTVSTNKPQAAAGDTTKTTTQSTVAKKSTATKSFTIAQVKSAAVRVKTFIDKYHRLPNYVTIGSVKVKMHDFLKLMVIASNYIKNGKNTPISFVTVNGSIKPLESLKSGKLNQAGYLDLAKRIQAYVDANGKLPNYANTSLGKMRFESLIYMYSKILNFQNYNGRLPNYVTLKAWNTASSTSTGSINIIGSAVPSDLKSYLLQTANCQVNNAQIKSLASSITRGSTSTYDKGVKIFNWVRNNLGYSFYYNTKRGAVGTLNARTGNCVDTSHLMIALSRAAGLPARYVHANARFTSGHVYGHVWTQIWVNGKWYTADGTSSRNTFGAARNWYSATIKGIYRSLPF